MIASICKSMQLYVSSLAYLLTYYLIFSLGINIHSLGIILSKVIESLFSELGL